MNRFYRFLKWFETNWNNKVPRAPYHVYTKESYSHLAPKTLVAKAWSEAEAQSQVKLYESRFSGVLFFYDPNTREAFRQS